MSENNEKRLIAHQIIHELFEAKETGQIQLLLMACTLSLKQLAPRDLRKAAQNLLADTRTCDFVNTSKETLLASSRQHIGDVVKALAFFIGRLTEAAGEHDYDKLTALDWFHNDFVTGFKQTGWWDNHRKIHRHHLNLEDGVPADVNLLDVLEYVADCVMAGMARSGNVYDLKLPDELLQRALQNTVKLLKMEIRVNEST
jgi:hypothetical protein